MAVAMDRSNFRPDHAVRTVPHLVHVRGDDGLGEAGPAGFRLELVRRCEKRLSGHDIDVDARFFVIVVFTGEGSLRAVFLGDPALLGGQAVDRCLRLFKLHDRLQYLVSGPRHITDILSCLTVTSTIAVPIIFIQYAVRIVSIAPL